MDERGGAVRASGTVLHVVGSKETIQDGALIFLVVWDLNICGEIYLAATRSGDVWNLQLIANLCEVMRVIGRRVDKLLGEVRGVGLGRENRLGRKLERGWCVEHGSRGHHGELGAIWKELSRRESHGGLLRGNESQGRERLTDGNRAGAHATWGHRVLLVPILLERRHGGQGRGDTRVTRKLREILVVARRCLGDEARVVDGATLGCDMVRVCAAVVVLLGNDLYPVECGFHLVLGSLDVEVAVGLAILGRGKLPEVHVGTCALHDEVDSLPLVTDDEADILGLDVELANDLALSHDLCLCCECLVA